MGKTHLRRVDYQRAGRGQQPATAWCDPRLTPDPEAALRALPGELRWCRVEQAPEPDPPLPAPPDSCQRAAADVPASPAPTEEPPMAAEHQPSAPVEGRQHPAPSRTQPLDQRPPGFPDAWLPIEGMFTVRGRGAAPAFRVTERSGGVCELERLPSPVLGSSGASWLPPPTRPTPPPFGATWEPDR